MIGKSIFQKKFISLQAVLLVFLVNCIASFAELQITTNSEHATVNLRTADYYGARGVKGDFLLPSLNAKWATGYKQKNFLNFEQWIACNNSTALDAEYGTADWFEVGYTDGGYDTNGDQIKDINYRGFFKAKRINGLYTEAKLVKTATVGTRYTFTIVDVNAQNLWEVYVGSTYFGSFSDRVTNAYDLVVDQGYEINYSMDVPFDLVINGSNVTNQYFNYGGYQGVGSWYKWNALSSYVDISYSRFIFPSWDATNNKSIFTRKY